ncbi:MAG: hypothetical protein GX442_00585 [Candidatus Riflebacteria bacterium]|nr:hypothetical protein [Candidatus Riflebacteria bacterium]
MNSPGPLPPRKPLAGLLARRGFVLFFVCVFALMMMILIASLSSHKSGEVLQISRTIEQERLVLLAEAALNEMLAAVKAGANDRNTAIGGAIANFWRSASSSGNQVVFQAEVPASQLALSNSMALDQLGGRAQITGQVKIVVIDRVNGPRPSYTGFVELVAKATSRDLPEIRLKERRELKIANLSYPFLDKYALFVKSFCRLINNPEKQIVIRGIPPNDPGVYSFVYLGTRSYPKCVEFPQGEKSSKPPPVLLDLCFKDDHHLLGPFYKPNPFVMANNENVQQSTGNLFFTIPPFPFNTIARSYSPSADYHNTPELVNFYAVIVDIARRAEDEGAMNKVIVEDFRKSGGNPANSMVFASLVNELEKHWKYQYGYTDYSCIVGAGDKTFVNRQPFSGLLDYFNFFHQFNPQRVLGGRMPLLYGEGRNTPVFVEGPVYLRFFKVALLDEVKIPFSLYGGKSVDLSFPTLPLRYENIPRTFSGKPCTPQIDERTKVLMSEAIDLLSINHLFFGTGKNVVKSPSTGSGNVEGYDVFPDFDASLRTVAHIYKTGAEFLADRVKTIGGQKVLDLDGVSLVLSCAQVPLDLTGVEKFRGKGRIVVREGNCHLGNLSPVTARADSLSMYLMFGNFMVKGSGDTVTIHASLAATTSFRDNSAPPAGAESGLHFGGKSVTIHGQLIVDNLFELQSLPNGGRLTIVHDPDLYFPDYPVRVSVGETKALLAVDYHAE